MSDSDVNADTIQAAHILASMAPARAQTRTMFTCRTYPPRVRRALWKWVDAHLHKPYPTALEKCQLMDETGLTLAQLNCWFSSVRRRHFKKSKSVRERRYVARTHRAIQKKMSTCQAHTKPKLYVKSDYIYY